MDTAGALIAALVVLALLAAFAVAAGAAGGPRRRDAFWTQYGGGVGPDGQARRVDAAAKGVPDEPWAEAYWPPIPCAL